MPRSVRIEGSATPIIETSSASRKSAPHRTSSAPQARGRSRSPPPSSDGDWGVVTGSLLLGEREGGSSGAGAVDSPAYVVRRSSYKLFDECQTRRGSARRYSTSPRTVPARQAGGD